MARKRFDLRIIGFGLLTVLWSVQAMACINTPATDYQGRGFVPEDYTGDVLVEEMTTPREQTYWFRDREHLIANARRDPNFDNLTELGVLLMLQRKHADAVRLFVAMERFFPGRYQTASNLGTALELMGHNRLALRWIRIGIRRNRDSHAGTEWLHARILEAKIALADDPRALEGRSIAGVTFEREISPSLPARYPPGNDGTPVRPYQLNQALTYQLRERLQFVKPQDPVVANLLDDWATLNLAGGPVENAAALYRLSWRYGAPRTPLSVAREGEARRVMAKRRQGNVNEHELGFCSICTPWTPPERSAPRPGQARQLRPGDPPLPPPEPRPYWP